MGSEDEKIAKWDDLFFLRLPFLDLILDFFLM